MYCGRETSVIVFIVKERSWGLVAGPLQGHTETNIQPNRTRLKLEGRIYIKMMNGQRITDSVRMSLPSLRVAAPPSP